MSMQRGIFRWKGEEREKKNKKQQQQQQTKEEEQKLGKRNEKALLCWLTVEELVTFGVGVRDPGELSMEEKFGGVPIFKLQFHVQASSMSPLKPPLVFLSLPPSLTLPPPPPLSLSR